MKGGFTVAFPKFVLFVLPQNATCLPRRRSDSEPRMAETKSEALQPFSECNLYISTPLLCTLFLGEPLGSARLLKSVKDPSKIRSFRPPTEVPNEISHRKVFSIDEYYSR